MGETSKLQEETERTGFVHVNCEMSIRYPSGYAEMHTEVQGRGLMWKPTFSVL